MELLDFYKRYIGLRVCKKSKNGTVPKPFKSGRKINTVKEVVEQPFLFGTVLAFKFKEDDSFVACQGCRILPDVTIDFSKAGLQGSANTLLTAGATK